MRQCPACRTDSPDEVEVCPVDGVPLPRPDPLVGRTIRDRYRVVRKLGEGGVGAVYLAEQVKIKRTVALKVLHEETAQDEALIERFRREARAMARLDPRHATLVHDLDQTDSGRLFIVMEYLEGRTLQQVLDAEGPLPVDRTLTLAVQMAEGLAIAHSAGVLHRDVKPHTIMVLPDDTVKVMDFGLTRLGSTAGEGSSPRDAVSGGAAPGTGYVAPELGASAATPRSDLYSLGAVLHEMLGGERALPPRGGARTSSAESRRRRDRRPALPASLEGLVMQLLEADPERRPGDAQEVLVRLRAAVAEVEARSAAGADDETLELTVPRREAFEAPPDSPELPVAPAMEGPAAGTGASASAPGRPKTAPPRGDLPVEAGSARGLPAWPRTWIAAAVAGVIAAIALGAALVGPRERPDAPGPDIRTAAVDPDPRPAADAQPPSDPGPVADPVADPPVDPEAAPSEIPESPVPEPAGEASSAGADAEEHPTAVASGDSTAIEVMAPAVAAAQPAIPITAPAPGTAPGSAPPQDPPAVPRQARRPPEAASAASPPARPRPPDPGQIQAAVQERLRGRGLLREGRGTPAGLTVEVGADGAVTLTGILHTREERDRAVSLARAVPGVTGVTTRINVRESWQGGS